MKHKFSTFFLILALGFLFVSNAKAGEREDKLVDLAGSGDVDGVRALLDQGVDVNAKDSKAGCTALHEAIQLYPLSEQAFMNMVRLLLDRGANINASDCLGYSPLTLAAIEGLPEIMRILIDRGGDVNKKDDNGKTPLMYANEMLEKGIPNGLDNSFRPIYLPLSPAEKQAFTNIVRMLKSAGAK
jgi:ankyrin repeat protein